jgi:hypothetical protein
MSLPNESIRIKPQTWCSSLTNHTFSACTMHKVTNIKDGYY